MRRIPGIYQLRSLLRIPRFDLDWLSASCFLLCCTYTLVAIIISPSLVSFFLSRHSPTHVTLHHNTAYYLPPQEEETMHSLSLCLSLLILVIMAVSVKGHPPVSHRRSHTADSTTDDILNLDDAAFAEEKPLHTTVLMARETAAADRSGNGELRRRGEDSSSF
jgi:hypothetical protein